LRSLPPISGIAFWSAIGNIIDQVQHITHRHHTWRERISDATIKPLSGGIIALVILGAVFVINILYYFGVFDAIANFTAPVITNMLGLSKDAVAGIVVGFLRKHVALGMLAPLALSAKQLVVSSVVLAMSFPCIATFIVLLRELGIVSLLKAVGIMIFTSFIIGGLLNLIM
jgi:ferrous iron transport protein B